MKHHGMNSVWWPYDDPAAMEERRRQLKTKQAQERAKNEAKWGQNMTMTSGTSNTIKTLEEALAQAKRIERTGEQRAFVIETHDGKFKIETGHCPIMVKWYDSDGHRHG